MKRRKFPLIPIIILLLAALVASVIISITFGAVPIPAKDVAEIVWYRLIGADTPRAVEVLNSSRADIIWDIRMPRVLMAVIVGAGLALSGVVMQAVVKNPLANGSCISSRWKRYGRIGGQCNTPTCREALFSARQAPYRKE